MMNIQCPVCNGSGKMPNENICKKCAGKGTIPESSTKHTDLID